MNDLVSLISRHGYLLLAAVCFAEAIGLPMIPKPRNAIRIPFSFARNLI